MSYVSLSKDAMIQIADMLEYWQDANNSLPDGAKISFGNWLGEHLCECGAYRGWWVDNVCENCGKTIF